MKWGNAARLPSNLLRIHPIYCTTSLERDEMICQINSNIGMIARLVQRKPSMTHLRKCTKTFTIHRSWTLFIQLKLLIVTIAARFRVTCIRTEQ